MIQPPPQAAADPAHDIMRRERQPLEAIFTPRSVAVIGASEDPGSVGRTTLWNLISSPFGGAVFPVNPRRKNVLGIRAYPRLADVPDRVDLAVIATPAATVPGIVGECADAGVRGAIILSAGFRERGPEGAELERQVLEHARRGKMRLVGPNCLGVMRPPTGLNATFASAPAAAGSVGFLTQSGALATAILDWSRRESLGFSAVVSAGSMLDVDWGDLIYYLGDDPRTESIVIYMESVGNPRSFLSAAREVALSKPVIVIKAGRTGKAAQAAASHTGSLTGSDEVLDAAFRRCGVLRVAGISDLFYMSEALGKQPTPRGPRLAILTNAGGPGVLATDALLSAGGELAELSEESIEALDALLPPHWSHANPVDILGDADPERYAGAMEIVARDPGSDGLLVVLTPQAMTDPTAVAEELKRRKGYAQLADKPVLASWMGGAEVADGEAVLNRAGVPTFLYPDTGARMFAYMWRHSYDLRALYETPALAEAGGVRGPDREAAAEVVRGAQAEGRTLLNEVESKRLLAAYGIPTVETRLVHTEDEAAQAASDLGYPSVLKLFSKTITHKTDVGGVRLDLADEVGVRAAYRAIESSVRERAGAEAFGGVTVQPMVARHGYELIVGSSVDPQFGPVLLFGSGGVLVEVYRDRELALPPLNTTLARRLMERTKVYQALRGVRGREPVDLHELERLLVRFSQLVVEQPRVRELDINPLLASSEGLVALDARVLLHPFELRDDDLPRPAIRPYPSQYVGSWTMKDGQEVTIRPIRPEDEPMMVRFHGTLSEQSVYYRYFHLLGLSQRVEHTRLTRICFIDYDREMALVAERSDPASGEREILAIGRLSREVGLTGAEFSILVSDRWQRQGLGRELLRRLIEVGRQEGLERITADILPENVGMQRVSRQLGFRLRYSKEDEAMKAELEL